jgi:NAD(P)-dependent dehydrogenase (short-subunit alcohol dehydrogenase family)
MCRAAFPHIAKGGGGSVINQSSSAAWLHPEYPILDDNLPSFHYSVTKAAINAMTHFMAGSVGKYNIRVNAIAPGPTMTEATKTGVPEVYLQFIIDQQMAIHRALEPEDVTGTPCGSRPTTRRSSPGSASGRRRDGDARVSEPRRSSGSSWAPSPTGRPCGTRPRR